MMWSGVAFGCNVGLSLVLAEAAGMRAEWAFATALAVMFVVNFCGLRYFVYRQRHDSVPTQFASYVGSALGFRACEYAVFLVGHTVIGCPYRLAVIGVLTLSFLGKYFFYKHVVFARRRHPTDNA
jgi:putative flippase GtrA